MMGAKLWRGLERSHNLAASLSHVESRQVRNDHTVRWEGRLYQIGRQAVARGLRGANFNLKKGTEDMAGSRSLRVSGTPIRLLLPPLPNRYRRRACRLVGHPALAIGATLPQSVQLRHRRHRQALVLPVAKIVARPLRKLARRRPAQRPVRLVQGRQHRDILPRVAPHPPAVSAHQFLVTPLTQRVVDPDVALPPIPALKPQFPLFSKNARIRSRLILHEIRLALDNSPSICYHQRRYLWYFCLKLVSPVTGTFTPPAIYPRSQA
jgi:hypothetical protein